MNIGQVFRLDGNPPIEIALRRSARARRLSLRVSQLDGRVSLTVPQGLGEDTAFSFAREKEGWLRRHLDGREDPITVGFGTCVPVEGVSVEITEAALRRPRLESDQLFVSGPAGRAGVQVAAFLKLLARDRLTEASDKYAALIGAEPARITLRDTRSRWGSCSSEGRLMYSWRLVMAPPEVLHYVAAHEVAHLREMNHGRDFWSLVEDIFPDYEAPRAWLRQNGAGLHRYRFAD